MQEESRVSVTEILIIETLFIYSFGFILELLGDRYYDLFYSVGFISLIASGIAVVIKGAQMLFLPAREPQKIHKRKKRRA